MNSKKPLYEIPVASTSFSKEAYWDETTVPPAIRFAYEEDGVYHRTGIAFKGVAAMRRRVERCCKVWHIDAYDTLVEVENSSWAAEIRADTTPHWRDHWEMHHYMIYISDRCFEVIADSWAVVPDETSVCRKT